jgi:hypothetical protein
VESPSDEPRRPLRNAARCSLRQPARCKAWRDLTVIVVTLILGAEPVRAEEPWRWNDVPRVVAFADVHGAYAALVDLLQTTGVVGPELRWTGGSTHLVSLGDLLDRGAGARRVLDLVMRLQREAEAAGGRFHVVLGNHEVMNLLGDLRYVSPLEYADFAAEEPAATRAAAFAAFSAASRGDVAATRASFDRTYPPGYFARRAAFGASGRYGAWLASLPAIVVINGTAYVHGGLPPIVGAAALELNAKVHEDLTGYLELRERLVAQGLLSEIAQPNDVEAARAAVATATPGAAKQLAAFVAFADAPELGGEGPLWYRGSVLCKPLLEEGTLDASLDRLQAQRVVVGHTPTGDRRVRALYGGKLVTLDTGMLTESFGGRPAALVFDGDAPYVQYAAPPQTSAIQTDGIAVAYGLTEAALREALEQSAVISVERSDAAAAWQVMLRHDQTAIGATFYPLSADGAADFELAAAALDDLLNTALIAPTVARTIDGMQGALQFRYPGAVTEAERAERGVRFSGWCPIEPQLQLMYAFDLLTANRGRSAANVAFTNDLTDLILIDQSGAFGSARALPAAVDPRRLAIPRALTNALRALDQQGLEAALGQWLDTAQIRALLARRDQLLATARSRRP